MIKKHPTKKEEKRVMDLISEFEYLFSVQNFERHIKILHEETPNSPVASMKTELDYQRITLTLYPAFFKESLKDQRKTILHEFIHAWVEPLVFEGSKPLKGLFTSEDLIRERMEEVTSKVENVLDAVLDGRKQYARKAYKAYLSKKR